MNNSSVALLVDDDNLSARFAGKLIREAAMLGTLTIRRIYCNDVSISAWSEAHSFRLIHSGSGKNCSDILLAIDAMDFAHARGIDTFAIASSDRDFSHIAHRLREMGMHVVGLGEKKAPRAFRLSCSEFTELSDLAPASASKSLEPIDKTVHAVLQEHDPKSRGLPLGQLNALVRRKEPSIKISELPEKTWRKYLANRPHLYSLRGQGAQSAIQITMPPNDD